MTNFIVTTLEDENDAGASLGAPLGAGLSLREAVALANASAGVDTISFAAGLTGLIRLTEGEIEITDGLTIDGGGLITISGDAGANDTTVDGLTDVAATGEARLGDNSRLFAITDAEATTTLAGLTLTGGRTEAEREGGGAVKSAADLTIENSVVSGNSTSGLFGDGGGVYVQGPAVDGDPIRTLTVSDSVISGNSTTGAEAEGGGLRAVGAITITGSEISGNSTAGTNAEGGGVFGAAAVTIDESVIADNVTTGADADGGGAYALGDLTVTTSTVSGNSTIGNGSTGGGLFGGASILIANSTINDNSTAGAFAQGGGVAGAGLVDIENGTISGNVTTGVSSEGGGVFSVGAVALTNTTVSGNSATGIGASGGGVFAGTISLTDSIVLSNEVGELGGAGAAAPSTAGGNVVGADGTAFDASGDPNIFNADPSAIFAATDANDAGVLADNGGPVQTIALLPQSGALANTGAAAVADTRGPSIFSSAFVSLTEGETAAVDVNASDATDAEGSGLSYAITGGADQARFTINAATGALSLIAAVDFEAPVDAGGDNGYDVEVTVTDSDGNSESQAVLVTILDADDQMSPPFIALGPRVEVSLIEGQTAVLDLESTDDDDSEGDGLTYSLVGGADQALFTIDPSTGALAFITAPDFEAPGDAGGNNVYEVAAQVTDSDGMTDEQEIVVTITDLAENEGMSPTPPSIALGDTVDVSIVENQTAVLNLEATDEVNSEGDGLTYAISGGADQGLFSVDATTGALAFVSAPDHEDPTDANGDNVYEVEVTVTDADDLTDSQSISVTITDEGPTEGNDNLNGTAGRDRIDGLGGRDRISGLQDRDTLLGGDGDDVIRGGIDNDNLRGGDGDDVVRGQNGADRMFGNAGDDNLIGSIGEDTLKGGSGDDRLVGGGASDRLFGGTGNDTLNGLAGDDRLVGAAGDDVLTGGTGVDRFIFRQNAGDDTVLDFENGREQMRIQNGAESFADLTITQAGADAVIAFTGSTITLRNFDVDDVDASDFLF